MPADSYYDRLNDELADCPADEWPEAPEPDDEWFDEQEREAAKAYANLQRLLNEPDSLLNSLLKAHYSTLGVHCGSQIRTPRP